MLPGPFIRGRLPKGFFGDSRSFTPSLSPEQRASDSALVLRGEASRCRRVLPFAHDCPEYASGPRRPPSEFSPRAPIPNLASGSPRRHGCKAGPCLSGTSSSFLRDGAYSPRLPPEPQLSTSPVARASTVPNEVEQPTCQPDPFGRYPVGLTPLVSVTPTWSLWGET